MAEMVIVVVDLVSGGGDGVSGGMDVVVMVEGMVRSG